MIFIHNTFIRSNIYISYNISQLLHSFLHNILIALSVNPSAPSYMYSTLRTPRHCLKNGRDFMQMSPNRIIILVSGSVQFNNTAAKPQLSIINKWNLVLRSTTTSPPLLELIRKVHLLLSILLPLFSDARRALKLNCNNSDSWSLTLSSAGLLNALVHIYSFIQCKTQLVNVCHTKQCVST